MASTGTSKRQSRQGILSLGHASLTGDEKEILDWSRERRLAEFQKINQGIDLRVLENTLFYVDTLTVGNGEILDILKLNPILSWQKVRDMFLAGPANKYTSTFHGLEDINYPEHFWKVIIENEREKLTTP
jgi:hypothetical protein